MVDVPFSKAAAASALTGEEIGLISQLSTSVTISGTTISADGDDNSYNDSGNGFVTAGFAVGNYVYVEGFTGDVANNIFSAEITALTAGKMTIGGTDGNVIVDDAAGETVTITKWVSARLPLEDWPGGSGGGLSAVYEDQKANNTAGGTPGTVLTWQTHTLNTEVHDDIGVTLASNQMSIPAGTYDVAAWMSAYRAGRCRARLQDVTAGYTVTMTIASPCVVTRTAHGLAANTPITFSTTGALPTGLTAGTIYFVLSPTANTFNVSATPGGAAINTSGSQSGTHSITVTLALSLNSYAFNNSTDGQATLNVDGRFTVPGAATVEFQYNFEVAQATTGLGNLSNMGLPEIYARVKLTQLS